jgi:L-histidine N-alpha-methyltransferase
MTARTPAGLDAHVPVSPERAEFADDVRYYLSQSPRQLPSRYLYDALGSALFEAICHLPWYGITRAESRLLDAHAPDILRRLESLATVVELGPGSGEKLRTLLQASTPGRAPLHVHLVDVSPTALQASMQTLGSIDGVDVIGHAMSYEAGLAEAARQTAASGRTLVLFLGSNIGNFDPPGAAALLRNIRFELSGGDALLVGADLVKPAPQLQLAYDDPLGVTAAFNLNLLIRINRELQGNFDVDQFEHEAVWNAAESRVEMHLRARRAQHVRIPGAGMAFALERGERIWTESSYKYRPAEIVALLAGAGFGQSQQWIDDDGSFALTVAEATD